MKIWLDDVRRPPDSSWTWVTSPVEATWLMETRDVDAISLDHDLGVVIAGREVTGYDVLIWIEERVARDEFKPPALYVHSANPVGRARLEAGIDAINRLAEQYMACMKIRGLE